MVKRESTFSPLFFISAPATTPHYRTNMMLFTATTTTTATATTDNNNNKTAWRRKSKNDSRNKTRVFITPSDIKKDTVESSSSLPFDLTYERVELTAAGINISICRPKSEDSVLDYYIARNEMNADPFWAALWPSARALSQHLATTKAVSIRGKDVAEIGCGLGLVGLSLALLGAKSVTLYDREPLCLECARLSAKLNNLESICKFEVLDWNKCDMFEKNKFDILVAADVLYEKHAVEPVSDFVSKFVKPNGGQIFIADPPLRAPQNRALFKTLMTRKDIELLSETKLFCKNVEGLRDGFDDEVLVLELCRIL